MALLPNEYLKSVVSIEEEVKGDYKTIGTGFMYFKDVKKHDDGRYEGIIYLVTAKHIFLKNGVVQSEQRQEVFLRFDCVKESQHLFRVPLYKDGVAIFSSPLSDIDVAVIPIGYENLKNAEIDFTPVIASETALSSDKYTDVGLSNGDDVYYLGFPLGLRGVEKNYAICRGGLIARVDSETIKNKVMYLDAPVFPGNSGGPVFVKPQLAGVGKTKPLDNAWLIGIATNFLSTHGERDSLSDDQIQKLEGHLGLSKIVITDAIEEAIEESKRRSVEALEQNN